MTARRCLTVQLFGEQAVHGIDVVADSHHREARPVEGFGRVAGRGGAAVAEHFAGNEKELRRVERLAGADQPFVAVHVGHVVRRQQNGVVAGGVQRAVGAVDYFALRAGRRRSRCGSCAGCTHAGWAEAQA